MTFFLNNINFFSKVSSEFLATTLLNQLPLHLCLNLLRGDIPFRFVEVRALAFLLNIFNANVNIHILFWNFILMCFTISFCFCRRIEKCPRFQQQLRRVPQFNMGQSNTKDESKNDSHSQDKIGEINKSSGLHLLEFHFPSAGMGAFTIVGVGLAIFAVYALCIRHNRRQHRRYRRDYLGIGGSRLDPGRLERSEYSPGRRTRPMESLPAPVPANSAFPFPPPYYGPPYPAPLPFATAPMGIGYSPPHPYALYSPPVSPTPRRLECSDVTDQSTAVSIIDTSAHVNPAVSSSSGMPFNPAPSTSTLAIPPAVLLTPPSPPVATGDTTPLSRAPESQSYD